MNIKSKRNVYKTYFSAFFLMFCMLILVSAPVSASAKTVAVIGSKKYSSLETAVEKVKNGQTIKLKSNVNLKKCIFVKRSVRFTLDLNKYKLTNKSGTGILDIQKGSVTIKNGTIYETTSCIWDIKVRAKSSLKLLGGSYKKIKVENEGNLTVSGSKFTDSIIENEGCHVIGTTIMSQAGTASISGGTFTDSTIDNGGKMTISKIKYSYKCGNGIVESSGITNRGGTIKIKSGTFKITGAGAWPQYGDPVLIYNSYNGDSPESDTKAGKMTIEGGTFTSNACVVRNLSQLTISGGKFTGAAPYSTGTVFTDSGSKTTITGGTIISTGTGGIAVDSCGTIKISGGTLKSAGKPGKASTNPVTGETTYVGSVALYLDGDYVGPRPTATVTGGTLKTTGGYEITVGKGGKIIYKSSQKIRACMNDGAGETENGYKLFLTTLPG